MSFMRKHAHRAPSGHESLVETLIGWRTVMERELPFGNIMSVMHARNCVGAYRDGLAPREWIWCRDWGRLRSRVESRLVPELKVEGEP